MKRVKIGENESYSEGNLDESTISYFLRHLENFNAPKDVKHKLKVVLIELVSNILVHAKEGYGSISIQPQDNEFVIRASNFSQAEQINKTIALANELKGKDNLREHYLEKLSEVSMDKQVSLGLIEISRLSEGKINVTSSLVDGQLAIHFEIRLGDKK